MTWRIVKLIVVLYIFLFSIELMGESFNHLGKDMAASIILITSNPFISFFIGLLATALLQSSSTTTSLAVAAVAAGSLSISNAVPMIMGANIGTSLTSTIVSLGYITQKKEFRRAISAGVIHDFFNVFTTILLLPAELSYRVVSRVSEQIAELISFGGNVEDVGVAFVFEFAPFTDGLVNWMGNSLLIFLIAFVLLFGSIKLLSRYIYNIFIGKSEDRFSSLLFGRQLRSFGWGALVTAAIQSSSISTSLIVPLVATGKVKLKQAFSFIMGSNVGTTLTALLAAIFKSEAAITIAFTHILFNLFGAAFFSIPFFRNLNLYVASKFGKITMKYRIIGFIYILFIFFLLPFLLIYFYRYY